MIDSVEPLTAKAKLAQSRAELLVAMGYETVAGSAGQPGLEGAATQALHPIDPPSGSRRRSRKSAFGAALGASVLGSWWRRHPLSSALQLGEPLLERYAQRHPGKLVAYSAGAGALLWLIKPWKLLSVATLVTLAIKSSDISGIISDLLRKPPPAETDGRADMHPQQPPPPAGNRV